MVKAISTTSSRSVSRAGFLWIIAIVLIVIAAVALPAFRTPVSINSLLASLAPLVLIAIGQAIAIIYGGIDLSVGAVAGLATVVLSLHSVVPGGTPVVLVLAVVAGLIVGLINGAGVLLGINPLLMTFAMAGVVQGVALLMQSTPGSGTPFDLVRVLATSFGPVPLFAIIAVIALLLSWLWMSQSRAGRVIQAAGYDQRIATRLGFPVRRATLIAFALSGAFAAIGGLAIVTRTFTADALVGSSSIIDSISIVLVAGIAITGGIGSLLSVLPAAVIIAVVGQIITLTGTDAYYQMIFKGVLLIVAMGLYQLAGSSIKIPWRLKRSPIQKPTVQPRGGDAA